LKETIRQLAASISAELVAIRRHLHRYPELSFQETETQQFVAQKLHQWGIASRPMARTGLLAQISSGQQTSGNTVALRADLDALPIQEQNDVPYKSCRPGIMHACGHDVHTTALLGAAWILQQIRDTLPGQVRLLFQPGEEKLPGGATLMIDGGALEDPRPSAIIALHVYPSMPAGRIGFRQGMYMASADEIYLTVHGQGGHAAMPHQAIDPVVAAAQIIVALQQLVSRRTDPTIPTVLTFGRIQSEGGATNVIPNAVRLEGTFRTLDERWRQQAHELMRDLVTGIARSIGATCTLDIVRGYPFLFNDPPLTARASTWAGNYLGTSAVEELPIRLTAEDFAFYSQLVPACMFRLGTANVERGITSPVHTDTFDVDEDCLSIGAGTLAWLAWQELHQPS
jgi:amidohydrolase